MSVEPLEIEDARTEPECPALDGARDDARTLRDARRHGAVDDRLGDRVQDDLDAGDLARQCIERQHSLAVLAPSAARQRHRDRHERIACLKPPLDATTSKSQIAAATRSTTAAGEQLIAGAVDDRGVLARLDVEYENQVLVTASGSAKLSGAVVFLAHVAARRTSPYSSSRSDP
jgi:hypothetical protein